MLWRPRGPTPAPVRASAWVTLHAGARALMADGAALAAKFARLEAWCRLRVHLDEGQVTTESATALSAFPTLDEGLLSVWEGPMSWLLVGRPLPPPVIQGYLEQEIQLG